MDRLTPEQRKHARNVLYSVGARLDGERIDKMAAAIEAAGAARDKRWRRAIKKSAADVSYICPHRCCAPLRRLMEEK